MQVIKNEKLIAFLKILTNFTQVGDPARTNIIFQSNSFSAAIWAKKTNGPSASLQVLPNSEISPDGTKNATTVVMSGSGTNDNVQAQVREKENGKKGA